MKKLDKSLGWGADDVARKSGDYFAAKREPRPWVTTPSASTMPAAATPALTPTIPPPPLTPTGIGLDDSARARTKSGFEATKRSTEGADSAGDPDVYARILRALRAR